MVNLIVGVPVEKPRTTAPQWTTHNMSLWEDIVLLNADSDHQPLLMINQSGVYTAPDIEKMENETLRKFQILKVIFIKKKIVLFNEITLITRTKSTFFFLKY